MYDQLYEYLNENSLLSDHQFGFRKFHSTALALLDCTNSWYMNMDRKMFNLVVFLDLKGHSTPRTSVAHKKALYEPTLE
jgi:hypothetical protein